MTSRPVTVFVGVGSNIDPERHILTAFEHIQGIFRITGVSTFYRTAPLGQRDQPAFLNGVWQMETAISVRRVKFEHLRSIEADLGRVRTADRYASRPIDLDLLLYGDAVIDEPELRVPDPDILSRPFVALPLLELEPDLVLPGQDVTLVTQIGKVDAGPLAPVMELTDLMRSRLGTNG